MVSTRRSAKKDSENEEDPSKQPEAMNVDADGAKSDKDKSPADDAKKPGGKDAKDKDKEEDELSEEDQQLKEELEMLVKRLQESNVSLHKPALEALRNQIRTSTSSMTSVPKPLKFLGPHYKTLTDLYTKMSNADNKKFLADIISVLGMTYAEADSRESLKYRLIGSSESLSSWGHEYVRHLAAEIMAEYSVRAEEEKDTGDIMKLAIEMVPFFLTHNAEADACDLLIELESLDKISEFVDKNTYKRVCYYLMSCASYVPFPDDVQTYKVVHGIYRTFNKWTDAMAIALKINDMEIITDDFQSCTDPLTKKQLAFMLGRQAIQIQTDDETLTEIMSSTKLSEQYLALARELDVMEAKTPEDIYKSHLENTRPGFGASNVDSARQNLASTFVNAFVNVGYGTDKLMTTGEEGSSWIYKNKDNGMTSAAASLGAIMLWDVEIGLTQIDKYLYSNDDNIKAGALLAIGIVNSGVRNESDPALALLSDYISDKNVSLRTAAIHGLSIAYAGSSRDEVLELLLPIVSDTSLNMELVSFAALALGMTFVGSCHGDITSTILQTMMERDAPQLKETYGRFMATGLALLYLGKQDAAEATIETLKVIEQPLAKQAEVLVEICAYTSTGNVLKIQKMLHICNDHLDKEKEDDTHQSYAVIGIALIAMGEDIGTEMAMRAFNHLMHYGEPVIRKAVPLALGLLCASNPLVSLLDTLSKYSHDNDQDVAINAIFAMGIVGAGTNNARLAQMLRQLASYYYKEPSCLFMVRIAQGLLHMGKGAVSINPFHSNRFLMSPIAVAGLLTTTVSLLDCTNLIFGKSHYLLYYLITAIYPRFLITLNEDLKSFPVTVRVGQAVDVVGQAGRPKTITGFQTHSTPVLMAHSERAELASDEYISLSHVLEGFVILKKNPDWVDESKEEKK